MNRDPAADPPQKILCTANRGHARGGAAAGVDQTPRQRAHGRAGAGGGQPRRRAPKRRRPRPSWHAPSRLEAPSEPREPHAPMGDVMEIGQTPRMRVNKCALKEAAAESHHLGRASRGVASHHTCVELQRWLFARPAPCSLASERAMAQIVPRPRAYSGRFVVHKNRIYRPLLHESRFSHVTPQ